MTKELSTEKTMTVKEVAEVLGVDRSTIKKIIKKLGATLHPLLRSNQGGYLLNEKQVTAIKLQIGTGRNDLQHVKDVKSIKTNLEKELIISQAEEFKKEYTIPATYGEALIEAGKLAIENDKLTYENEIMKPKAIEYDKFMQSDTTQSIGEAAKILKIGRNSLFKILREKKILMLDNTPYQQYMKYFTVIEKPVNMGHKIVNKPVTLINSKGIDYLSKKVIN